MPVKSRRGHFHSRDSDVFRRVSNTVFKMHRTLDLRELDVVGLRRVNESAVVLEDRGDGNARLFGEPGEAHAVRQRERDVGVAMRAPDDVMPYYRTDSGTCPEMRASDPRCDRRVE